MHTSCALLISNSWEDANTMPTHSNLIDHTGGRRPKAATPCFVHFIGMCGHGIGILPREIEMSRAQLVSKKEPFPRTKNYRNPDLGQNSDQYPKDSENGPPLFGAQIHILVR